jgi:hypothetical protein
VNRIQVSLKRHVNAIGGKTSRRFCRRRPLESFTPLKRLIHSSFGPGSFMSEIAAHLGIHYATVSRRLKQLEQSS